MKLAVTDLPLDGLKLIELKTFYDERGFFMERFNERVFADAGLPTAFVQDNHSRSLPGVLRGLHFQTTPKQGKFIGVVRGRIWDVAVDIRPKSATFGKYHALELSENPCQLFWIPSGFAHGFCVLGQEPADVFYKVDSLFNPAGDSGVRWNDPELAIPWPVQDPVLSLKDKKLQSFAEYREHQRRLL